MKKKSQYKEGNFGAIYKFDHGYLCNLTKFSDCQDKPCRGGRALVWLGQCIRLGARSGGCPKVLTSSNRASVFAEQNIGSAGRRLPTKCPQPGSLRENPLDNRPGANIHSASLLTCRRMPTGILRVLHGAMLCPSARSQHLCGTGHWITARV